MHYNPYEDWPETVAILVLALGFLLAVLARSMIFEYALILLAGLVFGRLLHRWKPHKKTALVLIILAFLMGYLLGGIWANRKLLIVLYGAGIYGGWMLEKKQVLRTVTFG